MRRPPPAPKAWAPRLLAALAAALGLQGCGEEGRRPSHLDAQPTHSGPIVCKAFEFTTDNGIASVAGSSLGESPLITCPPDFVYGGPGLECSFVDRACLVADAKGVKLCWDEFNLTLAGEGFVDWPEGMVPRLAQEAPSRITSNTSTNCTIDSHTVLISVPGLPGIDTGNSSNGTSSNANSRTPNASAVRNTSALPSSVTPDMLRCVPEPFFDFDFQNSEVVPTLPPEGSWSLRFSSIVAVDDGEAIDLLVTAPGRSEPPGDPKQDGKGSMMGVVSFDGAEGETELRFQFVRPSGAPVSLSKFYFTVFDISDGIDAHNDKDVTVSGISEYFVSVATQVEVRKLRPNEFEFSSKGGGEKIGRADVRKMWQSSLHSTVAFVFRSTSEFTLKVRGRRPAPTRLEFTGWSEIVRYGRKVFSSPRRNPVRTEVISEADTLNVTKASDQLWE